VLLVPGFQISTHISFLPFSQMSQEYDSSRSKLREAESERLALEEELRQIELEEKEMESQEIK